MVEDSVEFERKRGGERFRGARTDDGDQSGLDQRVRAVYGEVREQTRVWRVRRQRPVSRRGFRGGWGKFEGCRSLGV